MRSLTFLMSAVALLALTVIATLSASAQARTVPPPTPTPVSDATHKQLPTMPIVVDGVRYEPADFVQKFEGIPVHMVYDEATLKSEGVAYAFTSPAARNSYVKQRFNVDMAAPGTQGVNLGPNSSGPDTIQTGCGSWPDYRYAEYYWDWYRSGSVFNSPGYEIDLRSTVCAEGANWNDQISSLNVGTEMAWAQIFKAIRYEGDSLTFFRNTVVDDLNSLGFNDVTSSIQGYVSP